MSIPCVRRNSRVVGLLRSNGYTPTHANRRLSDELMAAANAVPRRRELKTAARRIPNQFGKKILVTSVLCVCVYSQARKVVGRHYLSRRGIASAKCLSSV